MLMGELGVVARYLRSVGAALHSPTWLPTGRLRATFLNPICHELQDHRWRSGVTVVLEAVLSYVLSKCLQCR
ncbi:hypothetical protein Q5P01_006566 [Channa striata]|uniref:Uncharacterized protein n=1 Tax=Channa striata TaxID=64152 RepID=A0AA88NB93_CHASR|nr:hypothetical protein Q5P01_006566 [Channa striata]